MDEKVRYLRSPTSNSLIENDEDNGFPLIGGLFASKVMDNNDYFNRCLSQFQIGKDELQSRLTDARKVLFNKEDLHNWLYIIREDVLNQRKRMVIFY